MCCVRSLSWGTMTGGFRSSNSIAFPVPKCLVSGGCFLHPAWVHDTSQCGKHWQIRNAITIDLMLAFLSSSFETPLLIAVERRYVRCTKRAVFARFPPLPSQRNAHSQRNTAHVLEVHELTLSRAVGHRFDSRVWPATSRKVSTVPFLLG